MRNIGYHRLRVIEVPVGPIADMPKGYSCRSVQPADLASFEIDVGPEVQAERFASGFECLGIFDRHNELIAVTWLAKNQHEDSLLNIQFVLPHDAAWDTGMWIRDDRRMGRAFAAVWGAIKQWLQKEGLHRTMSSIADYNVQSIISHSRLGARSLGYVTVVRVGRLQYARGARPRWRFVGNGRKQTVLLPTR